jgi:hypothetical protein
VVLYGPFLILIRAVSSAIPDGDGDCQCDREYVHRDLLPFLFTADCEPRDLTETPVAGDESWHIENVAKRDANKKALEQVEKVTDSEPVSKRRPISGTSPVRPRR